MEKSLEQNLFALQLWKKSGGERERSTKLYRDAGAQQILHLRKTAAILRAIGQNSVSTILFLRFEI